MSMCALCQVCVCRGAFLGSGGNSRWDTSSKAQQTVETANVYCEGKMQRILRKKGKHFAGHCRCKNSVGPVLLGKRLASAR